MQDGKKPPERKIGSGSGVTQDYQARSTTDIQADFSSIPLFPVRYAISRTLHKKNTPVHSPKVAAPFKAQQAKDGPPVEMDRRSDAVYTTRRLRSGFLYAFCRKNGVNLGWYLYKQDPEGPFVYLQHFPSVEMRKPTVAMADRSGKPAPQKEVPRGDTPPRDLTDPARRRPDGPSGTVEYQLALQSREPNPAPPPPMSLKSFDPRDKAAPSRQPDLVESDRGPYDPLKHPSSCGLLFIPNDAHVWLCFSDVLWDQTQLDEHAKDAFLSQHARHFAPKEWKGKDHIAPLAEADQRVAELFCGNKGKKLKGASNTVVYGDAFEFSRDPFRNLEMSAFKLSEARLATGAVIALDDPVGIVTDLASLLTLRHKEWSEKDPDPTYVKPKMSQQAQEEKAKREAKERKDQEDQKKIAASDRAFWGISAPPPAPVPPPGIPNRAWAMYSLAGIDSVREALSNVAAEEVEAQYRLKAPRVYDPMLTSSGQIVKGPNGKDVILSQEAKKQNEQQWQKYYRANMAVIEAEKREKRGEAEKACDACLDQDAFKQWYTPYKQEAESFNTNVIVPLSEAYLAWYKGERFTSYFKTMFIEDHPHSGYAFSSLFASAISGVQRWESIFNHFQACIEEAHSPDPNLVQRALILNQVHSMNHIAAQKPSAWETAKGWADAMGGFLNPFGLEDSYGGSLETLALAAAAAKADVRLPVNPRETAELVAAELAMPLRASLLKLANAKGHSAGILYPAHVMAAVGTGKPILWASIRKGPDYELAFCFKSTDPHITNKAARVLSQAVHEAGGGKLNVSDAKGVFRALAHKLQFAEGDVEALFPIQMNMKTLNELPEFFRESPPGTAAARIVASGNYVVCGEKSELRIYPELGQTELVPAGTHPRLNFKPSSAGTISLSVIGGILAGVGLMSMASALAEAKGFERDDILGRRNAMTAIFLGAGLETIGKAMDYLPQYQAGTRFMRRVTFVKYGGSALGIVGGSWLGVRDFMKAREFRKTGEDDARYAYIASGLVNIGLAAVGAIALLPGFVAFTGTRVAIATVISTFCVSVAAWATGIGFVLTLTSIFVADTQKRTERVANARQWLRQCAWGIAERFDSLDTESRQLKQVTAAL